MTAVPTPRLRVEAFECQDAHGTRRPLGVLDLTHPIAEALMFRRLASPSPASIPVGLFASAVPREVAEAAWDGRLAIPGLGSAIDAFCRNVGGLARMRDFRRHLEGIRNAEFALQRAEGLRDLVAAAAFVPPRVAATGQAMFYCHLSAGNAEYVSEAGDAYGFWRYDAYVRDHPRPDVDFDAPEMAAWRNAYGAWVRAEAPPMVFLTTNIPFDGIDAERIRGDFADEGAVDVPALLEAVCDDHHEDALAQIVDEHILHEIVEAWLPHAAAGTAEDLALEAALTAWNDRQTIHSYMLDETRYTATFADVGENEIAQWCTRHVERAKASLAAASMWAPASLDVADAPTPRAA